MKILVINGSYQNGGVTDQIIQSMVETIKEDNVDIEIIRLRDNPIEFCHNCRECTQLPGSAPGVCVLKDDMSKLIEKIESADAFVLASPTNFGSVTAIFKRFMERLVAYAYWPWKASFPRYRKANSSRKKAILVSSCGAPEFLGWLFFGTLRQLKMTAKTIGADAKGSMMAGSSGRVKDQKIRANTQQKAKQLIQKLL